MISGDYQQSERSSPSSWPASLLISTLWSNCPLSVSLYPPFPKTWFFSHLLLLYILLLWLEFPFPHLLVNFFLFETILYLAQVCSLTPPKPAGPPLCVPIRMFVMLMDCITWYECVSVSLNGLYYKLREVRDLGVSSVS